MRKTVFLILCTVITCILLTACGSSNKGPACIDIVKACSSLAEEDTFDIWTSYGEDLYKDSFDSMYGISYDMIDDGAILYTENGGKADEISIVHVKENEDVSIAKKKLEERIVQRNQLFASYKPEEVSKLDSAYVLIQGNYVALIISSDGQKYETEIRKVISEGVK